MYIQQILFFSILSVSIGKSSYEHCDTEKQQQNRSFTITVVGTGYVGLTTGAGLAAFGNKVICADIDQEKINRLQNGSIPFFEPGLAELVHKGIGEGLLTFTHCVDEAIREGEVIFIAVGTPSDVRGHADLTALYSAVQSIATVIDGYKTIIIKSTVPISTNKAIEQYFTSRGIANDRFDIVSNPEFLREGSAVYDFFNPDRLIIGMNKNHTYLNTILQTIYAPLYKKKVNIVITDSTSAEMIKYASNGFLAMKVSFVNEVANLCDLLGGDILAVAHGVGLDQRINHHFLRPGPGFGGSCFPKDSRELICTAKVHNLPLHSVAAALEINEHQPYVAIKKLKRMMQDGIKGKKITLLGLAFKANTDDIRDTPVKKIITYLQEEGAVVSAYDPAAIDNMKKIFPELTYTSSMYEAAQDADALLVLTEWDIFKELDFARLASVMKGNVIIDMRNMLDLEHCASYGFACDAIGRSSYCAHLMAQQGHTLS